jgi:cardiolipin synthase (CMP-forming)
MYTTFPNLLTILRFILIPFFLNAFLSQSPALRLVALLIFIVAAVSDFLDGYLARRWNEESEFGRLTDPLADKFLNISVLLAFLNRGEFGNWHTTTIQLIWVILVIEMLVAIYGIRAFYYKSPLKTTVTGKWKTMLQFLFVALTLLLIEAPDMVTLWGNGFSCLGSDGMRIMVHIFAWVTAIVTVISGIVNLRINILTPHREGDYRSKVKREPDN